MLKTNSKKFRENLRTFILAHVDITNYEPSTLWPETFQDAAQTVLSVFRSEKPAQGGYARMSEAQRFTEWASGLPSILDTACYYYGGSAVEALGDLLEETEQERNCYTESQAENLLTSLIYRELVKGANEQ